MANELQVQTDGNTGLLTYFILKDVTGNIWNGSSFTTYTTVDRNGGTIPATGRDDGSYVADMPVGISAGLYYYDLFEYVGTGTGNPLESDTLIANGGVIDWNGATVTPISTLLTTALTEVYRSTGSVGSVAQLLYEILGNLINSSISDVTKTVKKLDKTTVAKTYTLDSATVPTAIEETT